MVMTMCISQGLSELRTSEGTCIAIESVEITTQPRSEFSSRRPTYTHKCPTGVPHIQQLLLRHMTRVLR